MAQFAARSFEQHLNPDVLPKRILSLDGGGLRGVLTVGFLQRIEDILRDAYGTGEQFRLSDHYDLIGGTSTGSIIAAGLATGMTVKEIRDAYFALGKKAFKPSFLAIKNLAQQYDASNVADALKDVFGDKTMDASNFKTGLLVLSKRLDTGSTWPLTNNPKARYYEASANGAAPNKLYPLWAVVRASTAAPTYFSPENILIQAANQERGHGEVRGEFIDGGVSPGNNPSLQMVMTATVKGYGFGWAMGEKNLSVTSVGTGRANPELGLSGRFEPAALHAVKALKSVLEDCGDLVETVMQWMSHSPTARPIDRELHTLEGSHIGEGPSLTYHRYNVSFREEWFSKELGSNLKQDRLDELAQMDVIDNMNELEEIGKTAATKFIDPGHILAL